MVQISLVLVSTVTVGAGGAASIEFTSIPQSGTDLLLVISGRSSVGTNTGGFRVNGDNTTSYSLRRLQGTGSGVSSSAWNPGDEVYYPISSSLDTANTFNNTAIYFANYSSSANKAGSVDGVSENNATAARQEIYAWSYNKTNAITAISIYAQGFVQHTTASLYLITKA